MLSRRAASAELIELRYFCSTASVERNKTVNTARVDESRSASYYVRPRLSSFLGDRLQQIWPALPPQLLVSTSRFVSVDRMHQSRSRSATSAFEGRGSCHPREAGMELRGASSNCVSVLQECKVHRFSNRKQSRTWSVDLLGESSVGNHASRVRRDRSHRDARLDRLPSSSPR